MQRTCRRLLALCLLAGCAFTAQAGPYLKAGDTAMRHDLQLLADAGILRAPVSTWPLSVGELLAIRSAAVDEQPQHVQAALRRVEIALRREAVIRRPTQHSTLSVAGEPDGLRGFGATPRQELEAGAALDWTGERFAARIELTAVTGADDGQKIRADGSHLSAVAGNWMLSAGALERWWGPGWDGSLILSNHARPIPAVSVQRNFNTPPRGSALSWVGPWTVTAFAGWTGGEQTVANPRILGARFNFKPRDDLELGLARTVQWGGDDFANGPEALADAVIGTADPGNAFTAADLRWSSVLRDRPFALYGQWAAQDPDGGWGGEALGLAGAETWGGFQGRGSWRLRIEYADTTTGQVQAAYTHPVYQDGYVHRGRGIGHAVGGEARLWTVGAMLKDVRERFWEARLYRAEHETGEASTASGIDLRNAFDWQRNLIDWGVTAERREQTPDDDTDLRAFVRLRREFR
ncbi:MAG: capsule assembly Wzi family protein [Ectothiorhodospiraceae bacterium]|jgi:hypothetical protein|nr:capsule assembly Wzi family protein [Ectothiorhodospiraceae bacterium]